MLKWTVMARREADKPDPSRHSMATAATRPDNDNDANAATPRTAKPKRRRSSTHRRRSSTSRRSSILMNRNSLGMEMDKENQFTSTPIKSFEDHHQFLDALRDVSNLTPKDTATSRRLSNHNKKIILRGKDCHDNNVNSPKHKKKKHCLDPTHQEFAPDIGGYFRPFEAVDSHIKGILDPHICPTTAAASTAKRRIQDTYAPTLPTFTMEYSPCLLQTCTATATPLSLGLGKYMQEDHNHPCKKPRIDHVNDFLRQISNGASIEDDRLPDFQLDIPGRRNIVKVSPLVKKFIDLKFSQTKRNNNSSYLNDMSLDQIVDAILDSSAEDHQNERNSTQEDNLINTERQTTASSDSGFKSSTTEVSHHLEGNFMCKCSQNQTVVVAEEFCDRTIINIDETFNERCVDAIRPTRKRSYSMDKSEEEAVNFTLKRQKCIRRRKVEEEKPESKREDRAEDLEEDKSLSIEGVTNLKGFLGDDDDTFDVSIISGKIADYNKSTPIKSAEKRSNETFTLSTPLETTRRFRRCLLFESPTLLSESASTTDCSIGDVRGSMDLNLHCEGDQLLVNVIRCKDLYRPNGKQINAYVKVSLSDRKGDNPRKRNSLLQRTAVQADSCKPFFNHTFRFPLQDEDSSSSSSLPQKRLHIEVWHRDRISRTSEFLGCMSFDARHAYKRDISGSYRLLPQSTGRCQNVPITADNQSVEAEDVGTVKGAEDHHHYTTTTTTTTTTSTPTDDHRPPATMCESQSSVDEIMSLEDLEQDLKKTTPSSSRAVLNEQQKHADENLFLRYLELDPMEGPEAIPAAMQRKATGNKNGRTPFTHTKKLVRPPKSGFGFSVVWTHPPRIERVEKGLPADRAGILPGDYIIFVDKHNVVMMPEIDILNLIRSYGSQLTLEIFRRNTSRNGSVPSVRRLNSTGTCSTTGLPVASSNLVQQQRRPSTVCSTNTASVDYNRRKLHLPQVTFSAEVGNGVIV